MLDSLGLVSKQVGILFALMVVGFLCNRRKLLNAVAIKGITELLVLIVTPCVIVHSFIQQKFAVSILGDLGWALAVSVFAHVVGAAIAFACLHGRDKRDPPAGGAAVSAAGWGAAGIEVSWGTSQFTTACLISARYTMTATTPTTASAASNRVTTVHLFLRRTAAANVCADS